MMIQQYPHSIKGLQNYDLDVIILLFAMVNYMHSMKTVLTQTGKLYVAANVETKSIRVSLK